MVNPDSDLYRKHPDWVLNFSGRPRSESRNQLVLNLARPDVRDYIAGFLDKLLTENDIAFLKWDYNRNWSEPGWDQVPVDEQRGVYVEFIRNLYSILSDLRKKHPKVEIESCSGGGGRVIWEFCATPMRFGPRTIPIPLTGCRCRTVLPMLTPLRS
jgi:alpha-galactosidase